MKTLSSELDNKVMGENILSRTLRLMIILIDTFSKRFADRLIDRQFSLFNLKQRQTNRPPVLLPFLSFARRRKTLGHHDHVPHPWTVTLDVVMTNEQEKVDVSDFLELTK